MTRRPEFHTWLDAQMRRVGLNAERLAAATGGQLSASLIYRWLSGKVRQPSRDNLRMVAEPLGVPYVQLLVAAGYLTPDDVGKEWADPGDFDADPEQAILDSELSDAQKQALIAHYRSYLPEPEAARKKPRRRRSSA